MSHVPWFADPAVIHCHRNVGRTRSTTATAPARQVVAPSVFRFGRTVQCTAGDELSLIYVAGAPPEPTDPQLTELVIAQAVAADEALRLATLHRNFIADENITARAGGDDVASITRLNLNSDGKQLSAALLWSQEGWEALHRGEYIGVRPLIEEQAKTSTGELIGAKLQSVELKLAPTVATIRKEQPMFSQKPTVQTVVDQVNAQQGRNHIEKTNNYLLATRPSHKTLSWPEQIRASNEFSKQLMSGNVPDGVVTASARPAAQSLPELVKEINAQPGRNPIEKTNALLLSRRPAHKNLPWPEQCRVAGEISKQVMAGQMPVI